MPPLRASEGIHPTFRDLPDLLPGVGVDRRTAGGKEGQLVTGTADQGKKNIETREGMIRRCR